MKRVFCNAITPNPKLKKYNAMNIVDSQDIQKLTLYLYRNDINLEYFIDNEYYTLLSYACKNGKYKSAQFLLQQPYIDINERGPLEIACIYNRYEIVNLLLEQPGLDVNEFRPLSQACRYGHYKIVKLLLKQVAVDVNNFNPLKLACKNRHYKIVKLLLQQSGIKIKNHYIIYCVLLKIRAFESIKNFKKSDIKTYCSSWHVNFFQILEI